MDEAQEFLNRTIQSDEESCWMWVGPSTERGYGQFNYGKTNRYAHRASMQIFNNIDPNGMNVCHTCDNVWCVNPNHLFLGTQADNLRDMVNKGRAPYGEKSATSKLTGEQVSELRSLRAAGWKQDALAKRYGIRQSTVSTIVNGRSWPHITGETNV